MSRSTSPPPAARTGGLRPDPVVEAYLAGIDRSLLRQNLRRTPGERLENLEALQAFAAELRRAGRACRGGA